MMSVCCSVLQCFAVCCKCVAACCSVLIRLESTLHDILCPPPPDGSMAARCFFANLSSTPYLLKGSRVKILKSQTNTRLRDQRGALTTFSAPRHPTAQWRHDVYKYIHTSMYVNTYVYTHIYIYMHTYTYRHIYMYFIYTHIHIDISIYVCMHTYEYCYMYTSSAPRHRTTQCSMAVEILKLFNLAPDCDALTYIDPSILAPFFWPFLFSYPARYLLQGGEDV